MKRAGLRGRPRSASRSSTSRRKKLRVVTEGWDRSPGELAWTADGKTIYTTADNVGQPLAVRDRRRERQREARSSRRARTTRRSVAGDRIVYAQDTLTLPAELFTVQARRQRRRASSRTSTTRASKQIDVGRVRAVHVQGREGRHRATATSMKPAGFTGGEGTGRVPHPRRPAGQLRRPLPLPLEPRGVRGPGYARRVHRLPRLDRLRPGVHRRDQRRLGRRAVRGSDEGPRRRAREVHVARRQARRSRSARRTAAT